MSNLIIILIASILLISAGARLVDVRDADEYTKGAVCGSLATAAIIVLAFYLA